MKKLNKFLVMLAMANGLACSQNTTTEEENIHESHRQSASEVLKANGFRTGQLKPRAISKSFTVTGRVEAPPQSTAQVFPTIGAFVKEVHVIKGMEVKKGQKLADLRHPDITELQQRYLSAGICWSKTRKTTSANNNSSRMKPFPQKKCNNPKPPDLSAQSEVQGLASTLRSMGLNLESLSAENLRETIFLTAPIGGTHPGHPSWGGPVYRHSQTSIHHCKQGPSPSGTAGTSF
ncbi:MAG: efflux RND transporter periplasmic adaptor subunit [Owenweeksia sp.]|nr:efflux RND transporter periplasmic adaptor subunit [Owenweeksia sp.]